MVTKDEPAGFPPRGGTLYVFSIDGAVAQQQRRHARHRAERHGEPVRQDPAGAGTDMDAIARTAARRRRRRRDRRRRATAWAWRTHAAAAPCRKPRQRPADRKARRRGSRSATSPARHRGVAAGPSPNPFEGNARRGRGGHRLFVRMNCAGCHGYDAGGMGPNLTDTTGATAARRSQIYKSIYEGRPQGHAGLGPGPAAAMRSGSSSPTSSRSAAASRRRSTSAGAAGRPRQTSGARHARQPDEGARTPQ